MWGFGRSPGQPGDGSPACCRQRRSAKLAGPSSGVGNVDFLLLHVSQFTGSSTVDLFLNPTGPPGLPSATFTVPLPFSLSQFYYRSDPLQQLDEIRVGTRPTDVSAVPEPVTGILMVSAGFWLMRRKLCSRAC